MPCSRGGWYVRCMLWWWSSYPCWTVHVPEAWAAGPYISSWLPTVERA